MPCMAPTAQNVQFLHYFLKLTDFQYALWLIIWVYLVVISDNFSCKVSIFNITRYFGVITHLFLFSAHFSGWIILAIFLIFTKAKFNFLPVNPWNSVKTYLWGRSFGRKYLFILFFHKKMSQLRLHKIRQRNWPLIVHNSIQIHEPL